MKEVYLNEMCSMIPLRKKGMSVSVFIKNKGEYKPECLLYSR